MPRTFELDPRPIQLILISGPSHIRQLILARLEKKKVERKGESFTPPVYSVPTYQNEGTVTSHFLSMLIVKIVWQFVKE